MALLRYKLLNMIRQTFALMLIILVGLGVANAGILITTSSGISATGMDGVNYADPVGISATGMDGLLAFGANGINAPVPNGISSVGPDGVTYLGSSGISATGMDGTTMTRSSGISATGMDGLTITVGDGSTYTGDSLLVRQADGISATGMDDIMTYSAEGIVISSPDSGTIAHADGISGTGMDSIDISMADGITLTRTDGQVVSIPPGPISIVGAEQAIFTDVDQITITGADTITGTGVTEPVLTGLQSVDPELALLLNQLTDDSNVNAAIVYHQTPTEADLDALRQIGILGGTRYRALPVILLTGTKRQIMEISHLPAVRAVYGNRTLKLVGEPGNGLTGTERVKADPDLAYRNNGLPYTGRGVTVAVLDTGLDATHADLAGRVTRNAVLASTLGVGLGFNYPIELNLLPNTDLVSGHGTFVGGVIAGNGTRSGGQYKGVAPDARLVGLSAGTLSLFFALEGFDYLLVHAEELGVRVVNCSFSANLLFDPNDPVNVATRMLTDRGVNVVFSAGNDGPSNNTLNPYAMAPWVIGVGATDERGRLAGFSSRGSFRNTLARPTLVAPGVNVTSLRAVGVNTTALGGLLGSLGLSLLQQPYYTTGSGTSFSAPQVAGTIALMLEANPQLTPAQVRNILQRTATPLPPYYQHEAGAGMLNAHAAVLEAAFSERRMGMFRAALGRGQVRFISDPWQQFSGTVLPGLTSSTSLAIPANTLQASVQVSWGPLLSLNDLALKLVEPNGTARAEVNTLNLPGLTGRREADVLWQPAPGNWSVRLRNTRGLLGTAQPFLGALELTRAEYAPLIDLGGLNANAQQEVYQNLRSLVMFPIGNRFRPQFSVSRYDLASALVLGGRVPQYRAGQPTYPDAVDSLTRLMVESVQAAPAGAIFPEVTPGSLFRPDQQADRLTAAIALVRAAGLRAEAESLAGTTLPVADGSSIPAPWRGYVAVALSRGLLTAEGSLFRPSSALTRAELSHAMVSVTKLAIG
ncbi:MAG TPA: S8 family serine peptidase [Blastocatellia bacterium]|nr:S8 family serine peptidase [Blastocatellia bacterium]